MNITKKIDKYMEKKRVDEETNKPSKSEVQKMISLHKQLKSIVSSMNDMYKKSDFNSIQPRIMDGKDGVYPMSLDDWASVIEQGIRDWKKVLSQTN